MWQVREGPLRGRSVTYDTSRLITTAPLALTRPKPSLPEKYGAGLLEDGRRQPSSPVLVQSCEASLPRTSDFLTDSGHLPSSSRFATAYYPTSTTKVPCHVVTSLCQQMYHKLQCFSY